MTIFIQLYNLFNKFIVYYFGFYPRFQTKDGTAVSTANGDFQSVGKPSPLSVVFGPGDKQQTVSVNINDDKLCEKKETFTAVLSTNDASATVNDDYDVATVVIVDNDGKLGNSTLQVEN